MKIYEYARNRNIKSKDVVKKLHELGFKHVKNHLSLVPEKLIDELDTIDFEKKVKEIKKESKTIVLIAMECSPFISKGLGDMVQNKIKFNQLKGNKTIVIMPKYHFDSQLLDGVLELNISVNHQNKIGKVYKTTYEHSDYYLVDSDYFNRSEVYGYPDDAERFAFLAKASIQTIKKLDQTVDVINVHDWPLGLFPLLFNDILKEELKETQIEFSAYGSTYQGIYGLEVLTDIYELDRKYYDDHTVEYANSVNFLKTGLVTADRIDINKVALYDLKNSYLKDFVYDNM
ncbi:translation initiation factor IF-2 N-terminal domain-containing protein [Mycoplasmatota bacterium]|nr:translation initiation factor IF-2 N-terminal domain-containing protein [Mycoplasmatota bacterium]